MWAPRKVAGQSALWKREGGWLVRALHRRQWPKVTGGRWTAGWLCWSLVVSVHPAQQMVSDLCFKGCSIARTACGPTSFRKSCSNIVLGQCVFAGTEVRRLYSRVLKEVRPIDLLVVLRHFTIELFEVPFFHSSIPMVLGR